jgi:hypothetical protein
MATGTTAEVFTELGIDPVIGSVWVQVTGDSSDLGPSIQLSLDGTGTQLGPFLNFATMEQPTQDVLEGVRLRTAKDPVYITNSGAGTVDVAVAVFSDN